MGGKLWLVAEFPNRHPFLSRWLTLPARRRSSRLAVDAPVSWRGDRQIVRQGRGGPAAAGAGRLPCPEYFQAVPRPVPCCADKRSFQAYTGTDLLTAPLHRVAIIGQADEMPRIFDAQQARRARTPQPLRPGQGGSGNRRMDDRCRSSLTVSVDPLAFQ
jgi:hypothetical protein